MRKSTSRRRSRLLAAGLAAGTVAALLAAPQAAFATAFATQSLTSGPPGTTFTVTSSGLWTGTTNAALFIPTTTVGSGACVAYAAPTSPSVSATVTKVDNNTLTVTVPTNITLGTNGVAKQYSLCTYASTTASGAVLDEGFFTVTPAAATSPTISPVSGPSGGGSVITSTAAQAAPIFTSVTTPGVALNLATCPLTYGTTANGNSFATGVNKVSATVVTATTGSDLIGTGINTPYNVCFYDGTATSANLISAGAATFNVQLPGLQLSPAVGPTAGGNSITANSTANFLLGVTAPGVAFTTASTCPTTYPAAATYAAGPPVVPAVVLASGPRKVANNRFAVTVPALPLLNSAPTIYQACVYTGNTTSTSVMVGIAPYLSTIVPTLAGVMPAAGSSLGGDNIVVTGTGLPTAPGSITATLGGLPLAVTPVSTTAFTAVTPMHAPDSGLPLVITTAAGTKTLQNAFSFLNTITAMPNTAPNTSAVDLSIKGVGFLSSNFSSTTTDAHIYLVAGAYDSTSSVASGNKVRGQIDECGTVLVISDNELICNLDLRTRLDATGTAVTPALTATRTLVTATDVTPGASTLVTSAHGDFLFSDVGLPITGGAVPAGTVIVAVLNVNQAVLSKVVPGTTPFTGVIGGALRSVANVTTNSTVNLTAPAGSFQPGDVGLTVTGSGMPTGPSPTIVSVGANGASAVLSAAATAGATVSLSLLGTPVPNGTYTLTFVTNGSKDANTTDPNYSQSVVSSGSTFTVSPS